MIIIFGKKLIRILEIVILITTICSTCYATIVSSDGRVVPIDNDENIVSWIQVDHAEIQLSNGLKIAYLSTETAVGEEIEYEETHEIGKPIDILFVLDFSDSMNTRITGTQSRKDILISSTRKLIEELYSRIQESGAGFRIAAIEYSGGVTVLNNSFLNVNSQTDIDNFITNISCNTALYTATNAAIKKASEWWDGKENEERNQYTILITDGEATDRNDGRNVYPASQATISNVKNNLINFHNKHNKINVLSLLVGDGLSKYEQYYTCDGCVASTTNDYDMSSAIETGVKEFINETKKFITYKNEVTESHNFTKVGSTYLAQVEEEIVYGARLEVDYSIHLRSFEELSYVTIVDYIDSQMSLDSTSIQGTYLEDNKSAIEFNFSNPSRGASNGVTDIEVKIKTSKILGTIDDLQEIKNFANVAVVRSGGVGNYSELVPLSYDIIDDSSTDSGAVKITPPFGRTKDKLGIYFGQGIIAIDSIILASYIVIKKIKK